MSVPLRNHPSAVARSVCIIVSHDDRYPDDASSAAVQFECRIGVMLVISSVLDITERYAAGSGRIFFELMTAYRFVDISNDCATNDQECCPLESCQDSKDKERC
jgi:hypothetical protein